MSSQSVCWSDTFSDQGNNYNIHYLYLVIRTPASPSILYSIVLLVLSVATAVTLPQVVVLYHTHES